MPIVPVTQMTDQNQHVWLTDVDITTSGMNLIVKGPFSVHGAEGPLSGVFNAKIPLAPGDHAVMIDINGTLVVMSGMPSGNRKFASQLCWFPTIQDGITNLADIEIQRLVHIELPELTEGGAPPNA